MTQHQSSVEEHLSQRVHVSNNFNDNPAVFQRYQLRFYFDVVTFRLALTDKCLNTTCFLDVAPEKCSYTCVHASVMKRSRYTISMLTHVNIR